MTVPCLCKVDCGAQNTISWANLLSLLGVATLLLAATAVLLFKSGRATAWLIQNNSAEQEEEEEEDDQEEDCNKEDTDGDSDGPQAEAQEEPVADLRQEFQQEFETRFRDQEQWILAAAENLYQEYSYNSDRRLKQLSDRQERDTARLHGVTDGLRRRIADQQSALRNTNKKFQELRNRHNRQPDQSPRPGTTRSSPPRASPRHRGHSASSPPAPRNSPLSFPHTLQRVGPRIQVERVHRENYPDVVHEENTPPRSDSGTFPNRE